MSDTAVLLDELRALRRATQADARRYAPPLLVFGVLIIAAVAVTQPLPIGQPRTGERIDQLGGNGAVQPAHPGLVDAYWLGAIVAGTLFAVWWYQWRAARLGVELRTREQLLAAGATLLGFLVGVPALQAILGIHRSPNPESFVHLPLPAISTLVAGAALVWSAAGKRSRPQRVAGLVAVAFGGVSLLAQTRTSDYNFPGWYLGVSGQATVFYDLLLPSAVLPAGGAVGLVARWRTR